MLGYMLTRIKSISNLLYIHTFLIDIDECTTEADNCDTNAACTNNPGSFTCSCNQGYTGDGVTCMGICSLEFKQLSVDPKIKETTQTTNQIKCATQCDLTNLHTLKQVAVRY